MNQRLSFSSTLGLREAESNIILLYIYIYIYIYLFTYTPIQPLKIVGWIPVFRWVYKYKHQTPILTLFPRISNTQGFDLPSLEQDQKSPGPLPRLCLQMKDSYPQFMALLMRKTMNSHQMLSFVLTLSGTKPACDLLLIFKRGAWKIHGKPRAGQVIFCPPPFGDALLKLTQHRTLIPEFCVSIDANFVLTSEPA